MEVDYLIIGQGLAGSLLAYELIQANKLIMVLDSPLQQKASDVAAGVINPVVFRRMTKSWMIDELYPHLLKSYTALERFLDVKLFYPMEIKKILSANDAELWQQKYTRNKLQAYINQQVDHQFHPFVVTEFGTGTVQQSGRINLKLLIKSMEAYLSKKQIIRFEKFNFNQLSLENRMVNYQDITAKKIIFCEGHGVSQNPYFTDIQFKHTKGEVLRIKTENYNSQFILNKAIFLMPEGNQYFMLGATYNWDDLSVRTSPQARHKLQENLSHIFSDQYKITNQLAGIRPTTHDRRPVIGLHPTHKQIGIFNGLGSKGSIIGPYFASQLTDYLCGKITQLHPEVSIDRYFKT